ncbi:hypothetical protein [Streptomyces sp. NPDC020965]|uniref:hypothetical protein n=1 Tax=Streptomyces sp. NPDC020965 TaxID=3365105 RepID=UPI00379A76CD
MGVLPGMAFSIVTRIHLMMMFVLVMCGAAGGSVFGQLGGGRTAALVAGGVAGLGAGIGSWLSRRHMATFLQPVPTPVALAVRGRRVCGGHRRRGPRRHRGLPGRGLPPHPDGVTDEERELRRTLAYRLAAFDGLPLAARVSFRQQDDPTMSPAVTVLQDALWAGRAARVHVIADGHPTAGVLGTQVREQFATVILSRFTADTWRRLAPIAGPAPKQSRHPGRFHVIHHDAVHETQAIVMTDTEVVNWLTGPHDNES